MIKLLYKSFVPYLMLLVMILVGVAIFDRFAERVSMEPELIKLRDSEDQYTSDFFEPQAGSSTPEDTLYREARELFRKQQYRKAEEKLISMLGKAPRSKEVWNLRGMISVRLQEFHEAEGHFLKALETDPGFTGARINLASLYMNMLRQEEAESQYKLALQADPNNPAIHYYLGVFYSETDQPAAARNAFSTAAGLSSGDRKSSALCQLGMVSLMQNDTLGAREELNEAILLDPRNELARLQLALTFSQTAEREAELLKIYSLNPSSFQANYYLGKLYSQAGPPSKAEYHYRKAMEKLPHDKLVMKELGNLLISQQRMEEAELVLSGFTAGDTLPQAYFYQAKIASSRGNHEAAIGLYALAAEKAYQNYPEAYLNMAILYKEMNEPEKAIENYMHAIKANPHYSLAFYNLALLYTEQDSTDRAIESYLESIRLDPEAVKSWYNLGRIYDDLEDTEKAIEAYRHALQTEPGYNRALLALGNAYLRQDSYQQAIDRYLELLSLYPNYTKAQFNLGLAYTRQGEPGKAMEAYENLIEVDPGHVRARINLASLYSQNDDVDLAVTVLEDAKDIALDDPDIRFNLALQLYKRGQLQEASHELLQVIQLDEGYRKAYTELMTIYNDLGDDLNFEIIRLRLQEQFSDHSDFYETGKRLLELGEPQLALEAFDLAHQNGDDRTWLLYWTGIAFLDQYRIEEAIRWFNLALSKDPNHKFSLYRMGQALEMQGESERAAGYYATLLELDREFKIVHKSPVSATEAKLIGKL